MKSGHGRLTASGNAFVYNGDFKNDAMHGEGKWENAEDGKDMNFYCNNCVNLDVMQGSQSIFCFLNCYIELTMLWVRFRRSIRRRIQK